MKKRKWVYLLLIIIIVIPILYFYNAFNGNPVSKLFAGKELQSYLQETYPGQEFNITSDFYNFKIGGYSYDVIEIGDEEQKKYEFNVTGFLNPTVSYDGIYYENLDYGLMEKFGKEAAAEITRLLDEKLEGIKAIDVQAEVLQGTYEPETEWSKQLEMEKPLYIHVTMDVANMTKEDVLAAVQTIQSILNREGYSYSRVSFNGNLFDGKLGAKDDQGYLKYAVGFGPDEKVSLNDIEEYDQ